MDLYDFNGGKITDDILDLAGKQKKNTFINVYLSNTVGSDLNTGLDQSQPLKTLEKAFQVGLNTGNEFRIHIIDSSQYSLAARTVTGICIHIVAEPDCTPTITFNQLAFYNCHINMRGRDTTASITFLCTDNTNGWYTDNSFSIFYRANIESVYKHNGGSLDIEDCEIHDIKTNYAVVRLKNVRFGNSLGRIDSIYHQQGGVLAIEDGVVSTNTSALSNMIKIQGVFANIKGGASGDLSKFTTRVNVDGSIVTGASNIISTYGTIAVSNGGSVLDGNTFIKP